MAPLQPATTTRRGRAAGALDRISRNPTLGLLALLLIMWVLA